MPLPTVAATFKWKMKIATKLKVAAKATAVCGLSTPVDTTVAIELAASCSPFMKSNASASTTSAARTPKEISKPLTARFPRRAAPSVSLVFQRDAFGQVRHVEAPVGDGLEELVDALHLDDLAHVLLLAE